MDTSKKKLIDMLKGLASAMLMFLVSILISYQSVAKTQPVDALKIPGLYEPSGVVQLNDGAILAVEDEPNSPFVLLSSKPDSQTFTARRLRLNMFINPAVVHVNDLEGLAKSASGQVYAVTSHSRKNNGKRASGREKLMQLSISNNRLVKAHVRGDFRKKLIKAFPQLRDASKERDVKDKGGLNIEGLTFGPKDDVLWVGLRAPLFDRKAIMIAILNPQRALETRDAFRFAENPVLLDLDGGGIRDIAYDPILSGYLILSQREDTNKEKAFKLWLWDGNSTSTPRRVRINGRKKLKSTEGIAPVRLNGMNQLLLLNDDGNRKKDEPASYLLVDYEQLEIETTF